MQGHFSENFEMVTIEEEGAQDVKMEPGEFTKRKSGILFDKNINEAIGTQM